MNRHGRIQRAVLAILSGETAHTVPELAAAVFGVETANVNQRDSVRRAVYSLVKSGLVRSVPRLAEVGQDRRTHRHVWTNRAYADRCWRELAQEVREQ